MPENELNERSRTMRLGEIEVGMSPEKLLFWRKRYCREGRDKISEGRVPSRRLERRLRTLKAFNFPRVFEGMGPRSPAAGSRRENTRDPSEKQVTPGQEVQIGVEGSHFNFLP